MRNDTCCVAARAVDIARKKLYGLLLSTDSSRRVPRCDHRYHGVDGRILYWSKGAESAFGYASSEAIGRAIEDLIVPPDRVGEVRASLVRP
jgi:PAS domain-containing protein